MKKFFEKPIKDFKHYENTNKVFWVVEKDFLDFKHFQPVPCIFVERFENGIYGIIQLDLSIVDDPYKYTAWRKLIGQDYGFRLDVLLIDKQNHKLYNLQGKEIEFNSLTRSLRYIDKSYLGRMARMTPKRQEQDKVTTGNVVPYIDASSQVEKPAKDLKYYRDTNKVFWMIADDPVSNFKRYDKIPCIYVEQYRDGRYGIIQLDSSIKNDPFQYTAWRRLIGEEHGFIAEILLIDKSNDKLYNIKGEEISFDSLILSHRYVDKSYLARISRIDSNHLLAASSKVLKTTSPPSFYGRHGLRPDISNLINTHELEETMQKATNNAQFRRPGT